MHSLAMGKMLMLAMHMPQDASWQKFDMDATANADRGRTHGVWDCLLGVPGAVVVEARTRRLLG